MKLKELRKIYTESYFSNEKPDDRDVLSLYDGTSYLNIFREELSIQEEKLLLNLYKPKLQSDWHQYLLDENFEFVTKEKDLKLIHFYLNNETDRKSLLKEFSSYFSDRIDSFYIERNYGIIITRGGVVNRKKLQGFVNIIEEDYSTSLNVYIGNKFSASIAKKFFKEERKIFIKSGMKNKVSNFLDSYLSHFVKESLKDSTVAKEIRSILLSNNDIRELVLSLWENQGNQSLVAKNLFLHRNTINYRIEKFKDDNEINLKDNHHLFMCYLLLL